jgi:hypothetical protein
MFVAVTYCNILILVVIYTYHTRQNICGKGLLLQYKHIVVEVLFQQNQNWWHPVAVTMNRIFEARGYCNNTNILWRKDYFNKTDIRDAKELPQ